jgi:L-seryl-tRNA(Ser) seleniumtransferase
VGGGAAPDLALPSCALTVRCDDRSAESLARGLREAATPIIARIEEEALLFDLRTVLPGEEEEIEQTLFELLKGGAAA